MAAKITNGRRPTEASAPHRRATVALAATILAGMLCLWFPVAASAHHRGGPCDIHRPAGMTVKEHSKELIRCAAAKWPVKGGAAKAICIARRESGLNPHAVGGGGAYLGLFQHLKSAWQERFLTWTKRAWRLKDDALNGRTNAVVTIRIASATGWGMWKGAGC